MLLVNSVGALAAVVSSVVIPIMSVPDSRAKRMNRRLSELDVQVVDRWPGSRPMKPSALIAATRIIFILRLFWHAARCFTNVGASVHNHAMEEEQDKIEPETAEVGDGADADAYYGEGDADADMDLSFLEDEDAEDQEKHAA